jgi:hypothetical protein
MTEPTRVVVTDLDISFSNAMLLLVKFALAAIPAALLLFVVGSLVIGLLGGLMK